MNFQYLTCFQTLNKSVYLSGIWKTASFNFCYTVTWLGQVQYMHYTVKDLETETDDNQPAFIPLNTGACFWGAGNISDVLVKQQVIRKPLEPAWCHSDWEFIGIQRIILLGSAHENLASITGMSPCDGTAKCFKVTSKNKHNNPKSIMVQYTRKQTIIFLSYCTFSTMTRFTSSTEKEATATIVGMLHCW